MMERFGYFALSGAAIFAGMVVQGDVDFDFGNDGHERTAERSDRRSDRAVDRIVDRNVKIQSADTERALAEAVAELVRAQGSLVAVRMDDEIPSEVIKQAEHRRDLARQAVERIADQAKAESRATRDARRENIRDEIRDAVRS